MPAPANNKFWQLRSKHGRDKLFASPQLLWKAACEYFTWCDETPLEAIEYNGKDAIQCIVPKMRAFTLTGLCIYLDCSSSYFRAFKSTFKSTDKEKEKDFLTIITRIEEIVYTQKFEGAAAGLLNPNIIARDLGLTDKADVTSGGESLAYHITLNLTPEAPKGD